MIEDNNSSDAEDGIFRTAHGSPKVLGTENAAKSKKMICVFSSKWRIFHS